VSKKILIVEDDDLYQNLFKRQGQRADFEVIQAFTIDEARTLFAEHNDILAIGMDGCVPPGNHLNTEPLIRDFRKTFSGPIVAMSSDPDYQKNQLRAGCSHKCEKFDLIEFVSKLI